MLGRRRDLEVGVYALANTQGGVLVVGVKDPKPEGSPPKDPGDSVGVVVEADHRCHKPRVFTRVKMTMDTFQLEGDW